MGKGSYGLGGNKNAGAWPGFSHGQRRYAGCRRKIVYGERCPDCARELRQRKRRKPR